MAHLDEIIAPSYPGLGASVLSLAQFAICAKPESPSQEVFCALPLLLCISSKPFRAPHQLNCRVVPELFVKRRRFPISAERLFAWHAEPEALERLMPPWEHARVVRRTGTIREVGPRVEIRVRIGPFWRAWISEHMACQEGRMFRDSQIMGPFAVWRHTHSFEPDGPSACYLEDRVEYALPLGALGRIRAGRFVRRKVDRLFLYLHEVTARAAGAGGGDH